MAKPHVWYSQAYGRWCALFEWGDVMGPFGKDSLHDWLTRLAARGDIHG